MSNPSTLTIRECNSYDAVCVASVTHAAQLKKQAMVPVHTLLQCTDREEFERSADTAQRKGFIFVGNSRGVRRPCLEWAIGFGLDLQIYGRGWRDWNLEGRVVADYVANEDLPALYAGSRLTINDHWHDMKALGYVNNRIFDCLATGLPVLSDTFPELRQVCANSLLYYDDQESFNSSLTEALMDYPSVLTEQQALWREIQDDFSFERRAAFLYELARELRRNRQVSSVPGPTANPQQALDPFQWARLEHIEAHHRRNPTGNYCPLCGTNSEGFLAGGVAKKRKNAKCPGCGALERHRLFWLYFVNDLWPRLPQGLKQLLHVSPEEQIAKLVHEREDINYLSADLTMPNVMVKLDLTAIEFPDNRFDLIICSHVLEHIPDDHRAMAEIFRVTKPGGYVLVMVPLYGDHTYEDPSITSREGRLRHFGQADHVRKYGRDIEERLSRAKFQVAARRPASGTSPEAIKYMGLSENQVIFECYKPQQ